MGWDCRVSRDFRQPVTPGGHAVHGYAGRALIGRGRAVMGRSTALLVLLAVLTPTPGIAADARPEVMSKQTATQRTLRDAERLRGEQLAIGKDAAARARRADAEAQRLLQARVDAAARLQQADAATADVAARIDALAVRRRDAEQRLTTRAAAMQPLLPLIERLSLYPVETLLAVPGAPEATLRGVMVLRGLSQRIEIEAEALRQDQADLDAAGAALAAEAPRLAAARATQTREAATLDEQIAAAHREAAKAEGEASEAAAQAAAAAARTDTLRSALLALEAQERADAVRAQAEAARAQREAERAERQRRPVDAPVAGPVVGRGTVQRDSAALRSSVTGSISGSATPTGQLQAPVIGVVVKGWGQQTDGGPATGLSYIAPPAARVISPCGGRVVFADSFRSFGLLLIVDCGGGYHIVLSGFDRLDVRLGQSMTPGEPVGVMPSWEPGSTTRRPALYVELRHDGQPVNPAPWLKSSS